MKQNLVKKCVFMFILFGITYCDTEEKVIESEDVSKSDKPPAIFVETSNLMPEPINAIDNMISEHLDVSALSSESKLSTDMEKNNAGVSEMPVQAHLNVSGVQASTEENNSTTSNSSAEAKNKLKVECTSRVLLENEVPTVQLTNSTVLLKVLTPAVTNNTASDCIVVLFFSSQCVFSARMGPHYNALPRVFPDIVFYAVDVLEHSNLHVRFGLVYVPNVMLFHNAKPIARFNETVLNLEQFVKFVNKFTGLQHNGTLNVTSADMTGPVPASLTKRVDYLLILAWAFTIFCFCLGFAKSIMCHRIVEFLKNTWQEAEAQHEHEE